MEKLYRDQALVMRTHKLGEADRIITLLTRRHGTVRAVAKGVRKTASRIGARLEPFSVVDVQLHRGRNLDTVSQVVTIETCAEAIVSDFDRYAVAVAMLEVTGRLTETYGGTGTGSEEYFFLLLRALRAVAQGRVAPGLLLDSYMLRVLALAGWAPETTSCASCGAQGPHHAFDNASGGAVCRQCRPAAARAVRPATLELMTALAAGDWEKAGQSDGTLRAEASRIIHGAASWQLEAPLKSLDLLGTSIHERQA
ncbi:DNA repair protein RecO [Dermabacteraceae bacterium P13088]